MANGKILRQLFRAGTAGDADAFRLASKAVIEEERQKQHHLLANGLEQILYGSDLNLKASSNTPRAHYDVPVACAKGIPVRLGVRCQGSRAILKIVCARSIQDAH